MKIILSACKTRPGLTFFGWLMLLVCGGTLHLSAATDLSAWVFPGSSGRLLQVPDALGNRVLDFSSVGYKGGTVPLPDVTVKTNVAPGAGDDTARIQGAINYVKTLPLDASGFRGAVRLSAGEYQISNSITIDASGIVLRGVGDGSDTNSNTILRAGGTNQSTLIVVSGSGSPSLGTARNITNVYVPNGARSFNVNSTAGLTVGGRVIITRPFTTNWISVIGMDQLEFPWSTSLKLEYDRTITRIEGSCITLDAPISTAIESQYGGGTIQPYTWSGRITNVGIENLRGVSSFNPLVITNTGASSNYYADENHGWTFIGLDTAENIWVRDVTSLNFGFACVSASSGIRNLTVRDCTSLDPVSIITGARRYAFVLNDAQFCLIQNCTTRNDRHQFVTQSLTPGPNVFVDGVSTNAYADAGPHFLWGNGASWDNITVYGDNINVQNRGNLGTQHGWAGANEVIWNSKADGFIVQNPPTARNWLIGSVGPIQNGTAYVGPHDPGTYDSHGTNVFPNSLYYAQLQDRLAAPNLQTREFWIGDIDQFVTGSPTGEVVQVDFSWRTNVQAAAGSDAVNGFDLVVSNQWVPLTFSNTLAANERIVGASLALALRASSARATNGLLYLDSLTNSRSFASLGWLPIGTGTNTTVRVLDLGNQLGLLSNGQLNLAVQKDLGIDWAMLEVQVTTNAVSFTNTLPPVADNFVRGGIYAGENYGSSTILTVKQDTSPDTQCQSYLRWDLTGVTNQILHARIRLTPTSVGTNGLQHGVTLATSNVWNETSLTWSNQPGGGKRFATWIPSAGQPLEFVVTPQAQAAWNGDRQLALQLFSLSAVGGPGIANYASREDVSAARRPQLILTLAGAAPNTAPSISTITNRTVAMDGSTGPIGFTVSDTESVPQNLSLTATSSNPPLVPVTNILFDGSGTNRTVLITAAPGQLGSSLITVTVTDPGGLTTNTSFTLTVADTPTLFATNDSYSVDEDTLLAVSAPGVLANDANTNGTNLFAVLLDSPTNGVLTLKTNGSFTYLPATNYHGLDQFTYRVTDGGSTSGVASVTLTILPVNDPPLAANDNYSVVENTTLIVALPGVLANDTDPETNTLLAELVAGPAHGLLTLNTNGGFTYQPTTNYNGSEAFTYFASDGSATSSVATVTFTVTPAPPPSSVIWSGASASNLNWSNLGNWLPADLPGDTTDVWFFDLGAATNAVMSNTIVSASLTVRSLAFSQTNGYHNLRINPGVTLTVSNEAAADVFLAGTETQVSASQQTTNTISGAGGALNIIGTNPDSSFIVREAHTTAGTHRATLDLSGLDRLNISIGNLLVGVQESIVRPAGTLLLARTNTISVTGAAPALSLGDGASNGGNAIMQLGQTNRVFADSVSVSGRKSTATLQFNPVFTNSGPAIYLRGQAGSRVAKFSIGDNSNTSGSGSATTGTVDFTGGSVDALVEAMYVGRSQNGSGAGTATGMLTFSAGTLDVNTLEVGYQNTSTVASVTTGTVNVNGTAMLKVNSSLRLARFTGSGTIPVANLNVNGGTLRASIISTDNPGTATLAVTNGTLNVTSGAGTVTAPLGTLRLANARLEIPVVEGVTNLIANSVIVENATTNSIHITSLPTITNYPARFPLIRYATLNSFSFTLGSLPGTAYLGSLSNNTTAGTVDLIITTATPPQFTNIVLGTGGSFTLSGTGPAGAGYRLFATTNLVLSFSNWTLLATGTFSGGLFNYPDTQATNHPSRFYRVVTP